ncbi:MAG: diphthine--ammonia ligase [Candidatus Nanohaloarchaea archaeon]|nr:diphthine--ammonia ligase [Candidatus Nanohaloarchaea archaeon]
MCGIAGGEDVETLVEHLQHRGDTCRIDRDAGIGHVHHPIVGDVPQPIGEDTTLAANCEIYDWEGQAERHGIDAENDADLLHALLEADGADALDAVDGVYAVAHVQDGELLLARDLLGVKPLWYATEPFAFASERQALEAAGREPRELHPRSVLRHDPGTGETWFEQRDFFTYDPDAAGGTLEENAAAVADRLRDAVAKRVPDEPIALLFSGGLDSTVLAHLLQDVGAEFTCYTASIQHGNTAAPRDREWAVDVAERCGFDLEHVEADLNQVADALPRLADWLSTTSAVKLGVALPFHVALEAADERVAMSGLGAEQLYAGYSRQQGDLNRDCLSGLRSLFHRDLYRDDVVAMRHGAELRVPFLDHSLVRHSLTIPAEQKVRDGTRKAVLRPAAEQLGVPEDVAWREKTAAQYGSNFDKAIDRLARNAGCDRKQAYLNDLRSEAEWRLAALTSGGKDSTAALHRMHRRGHDIACLVTLRSDNAASYMFDVKKADSIVAAQADALDLPLVAVETAGEKEAELDDLERALHRARDEHGVDGVVAGALASQYQRDRVERVAERAGLKAFAPLWAENQERYMRWLIDTGFEVQITATAARGLDAAWEGRTLDGAAVDELVALADEHGFHPAGEGGGYETVVVDAPLFDHRIDPGS